jgi:hypothetical protein
MLARSTMVFSLIAVAFSSAALARDGYTPPDSTHIPFSLPADIKWVGHPCSKSPCGWGDFTYNLFGDPAKPGMYGQLVKWMPGFFSKPHRHDKERYIVVVSGIWWVSSSDKQDMTTLYPLRAGTIARDVANTVHWDGSKKGGEPAVIEIVGMGPVSTVEVGDSKNK